MPKRALFALVLMMFLACGGLFYALYNDAPEPSVISTEKYVKPASAPEPQSASEIKADNSPVQKIEAPKYNLVTGEREHWHLARTFGKDELVKAAGADRIHGISFANDGLYFATLFNDGKYCITNVRTNERTVLPGPPLSLDVGSSLGHVIISESSSRIVTISPEEHQGRAHLWETKTSKELGYYDCAYYWSVFSPDGKYFLANDDAVKETQLVDAASGRVARAIPGLGRAEFSANGSVIYARVENDKTTVTRGIDLRTGRKVFEKRGEICQEIDGEPLQKDILVTTDKRNGRQYTWIWKNSKNTHELRGVPVYCFSADRIMTSEENDDETADTGFVRIYDLKNAGVTTFAGEFSAVSHDGRFLATVTEDYSKRTVMHSVWDINSNRLVSTTDDIFIGFDDNNRPVVTPLLDKDERATNRDYGNQYTYSYILSPDGKTCATVTNDGVVLWETGKPEIRYMLGVVNRARLYDMHYCNLKFISNNELVACNRYTFAYWKY